MIFRTEEKEFVCAVCGESSKHEIITEQEDPKGAPDLDMRPDEPVRSGIKYWVSKCPCCGYCNSFINIPVKFTREYLDSPNYNREGDDLAGRFMKKSLACEKNKEWEEALKSCMYAAWVCDDEGDSERAAECRRAAVRIFDTHGTVFKENADIKLLAADLLRRSGAFDRVIHDYKNYHFGSPLIMVIAAFEVKLAEQGDAACHKADEIPGVRVK